MKRTYEIKHWYDLDDKERQDLKKQWTRSHWHASMKSNINSDNILAIISYHLGAIVTGFFIAGLERPVFDSTINLIIGAVGITIFVVGVFVKLQIESKRRNELRKWLREKHNIIYN